MFDLKTAWGDGIQVKASASVLKIDQWNGLDRSLALPCH
jgi:hypothetical protein